MKISFFIALLMFFVGCATVYQQKSTKRLSPEWHDIAQARQARHPMPRMDFIYNDTGKKLSDAEFMAYVEKHTPEGAVAKYFKGINLFGRKVIRFAVVYYENTNRQDN